MTWRKSGILNTGRGKVQGGQRYEVMSMFPGGRAESGNQQVQFLVVVVGGCCQGIQSVQRPS